jgi:hypothetical protein
MDAPARDGARERGDGEMKKIMFLVTFLLLTGASQAAWGQLSQPELDVNATLNELQGIYSGTYSGTDYGTWTVKCDSSGKLTGVSWSEKYGIPDAGTGSVNVSGKFTSNMDGGAILKGVIDSTGIVTGSWSNSSYAQSGTLEGRKNLPSELAVFMGAYSGTYSGTDHGTWDFIVDSSGNGSGTIESEQLKETYSGYGILNASGEITAIISNGSILHGMIDSSGHVAGIWHNSLAGNGTIYGSKILVPPVAPNLQITISGITAYIVWNPIPDALGYTLYYAPLDISYIGNIDVGTHRSLTARLDEGVSYYVAVKAYNDYGSSEYSNIELLEIPIENPSTPGPVTDLEIDTTAEDCNTLTWLNPDDKNISHIEIWSATIKPGIPEWSYTATYSMKNLVRYENRIYKCIVDNAPAGFSPLDPVHGNQGKGEIFWWLQAYPYKLVTYDAFPRAVISAGSTQNGQWEHRLDETDELKADWYYWVRVVDFYGRESNWRPKEYMEGILAPAKIQQ